LFTNDITIQGRKQKIACEKNPRRTSRVSRQATVEVRAGTVERYSSWRTVAGKAAAVVGDGAIDCEFGRLCGSSESF
jgi:hypothetical protein